MSDMEQQEPDMEAKLQQWKDLGEQSQRVIAAFMERQKEDESPLMDMDSISKAFMEMNNKLLADPVKFAEAQQQLWQDSMSLWQNMMQRMAGQEVEPVIKPEPGDRRFKDASWDEELAFDYIKQSYLLTSRWTHSVTSDVEGMDPKEKNKVDFYSRQFINAMSPTNFAATNPTVMKAVQETGGQNLLDGLKNVLNDVERGRGELKVSMTDVNAFTVGENVATTPGKVIFQNDLMQLIQYNPSTEEVYKRPLLIVPPWINKYYVLDLQPKNSLFKWIVDQGYTLFIVSWINPDETLADKNFADYMLEGPLAAIEAIEQATGEKDINAVGFCIGGILLESTLAWMAARDDKRIKSATLLATLLDFQEVGEVSVFVDDELVDSLEKHVGEKGYLDGKHMAQMFNMMRENDLIWSFVVNNYLLGKEAMPFDLLYWNSDSTRLPAEMLLYYIKKIYLENGLIKPDYLEMNGEKLDVTKIKTPTYVLATKEDHIAPWISCYPVTQAFSGPVKFVLGGSGHIAGVVNPPVAEKYCYWTHSRYPADPQGWFDKAKEHAGSWWTDWDKWLSKHSGKKVAARTPGDGALAVIEDAPGSYVKTTTPE